MLRSPCSVLRQALRFANARGARAGLGALVLLVGLAPVPAGEIGDEVAQFEQLGVLGFSTNRVAYAPDGKRIAAALSPGVVRLVDAETLALDDWQILPEAFILSMAWSPDGRLLALGHHQDANSAITLWDVERRALVRTLKGHERRVTSLSWSPDSRRLASSGYDGRLRVWEVESGQQVYTVVGAANAAAWSPDGEWIATGSSVNFVRIFDAATGRLERELRGHTGDVFSVAWRPDSRYLASGGDPLFDRTVRVWEPATGTLVRTFTDGGAYQLAWSPDGSLLAAPMRGGIQLLEPIKTGKLVRTLAEEGGGPTSFAWHPAGALMVTATRGQLMVWETATGLRRAARGEDAHGGDVQDVRWSPDGRLLASAGYGRGALQEGGRIKIWDPAAGGSVRTLVGKDYCSGTTAVAWSPDGRALASANSCHTLTVWDWQSGTVRYQLPNAAARLVAWHPAGTLLATGTERRLFLWDAETGTLIRELPVERRFQSSMAWDPEGRWLAVASTLPPSVVTIWDAATWKPQTTLPGVRGPLWSLAWSPDGAWLAAVGGSGANQVVIWEVASGQIVRTIEEDPYLASVAWHPGGAVLATGGAFDPRSVRALVRMWDAEQGTLLRTLLGHTQGVSAVAWSRDGRLLATGAADSTVRLWGVRTEPHE